MDRDFQHEAIDAHIQTITTLRSQLEQAQGDAAAYEALMIEATLEARPCPSDDWWYRAMALIEQDRAGAALLAERDRMGAVVLAAEAWFETGRQLDLADADDTMDDGEYQQLGLAYDAARMRLAHAVEAFQQQGGEGAGDDATKGR